MHSTPPRLPRHARCCSSPRGGAVQRPAPTSLHPAPGGASCSGRPFGAAVGSLFGARSSRSPLPPLLPPQPLWSGICVAYCSASAVEAGPRPRGGLLATARCHQSAFCTPGERCPHTAPRPLHGPSPVSPAPCLGCLPRWLALARGSRRRPRCSRPRPVTAAPRRSTLLPPASRASSPRSCPRTPWC